MRRLAAALIVSLGLATPAFADTLDVLKQNTLMLHEKSGRSYTILISEGGTLEQVNSAGTWATGPWNVQDGRFCWTARGAATLCIPVPAGKGVGDTWEIRGPTGQLAWTAEIVEGRADLEAAKAANQDVTAPFIQAIH
jgi:hypothetical protein